jgi:hypothetical protein
LNGFREKRRNKSPVERADHPVKFSCSVMFHPTTFTCFRVSSFLNTLQEKPVSIGHFLFISLRDSLSICPLSEMNADHGLRVVDLSFSMLTHGDCHSHVNVSARCPDLPSVVLVARQVDLMSFFLVVGLRSDINYPVLSLDNHGLVAFASRHRSSPFNFRLSTNPASISFPFIATLSVPPQRSTWAVPFSLSDTVGFTSPEAIQPHSVKGS